MPELVQQYINAHQMHTNDIIIIGIELLMGISVCGLAIHIHNVKPKHHRFHILAGILMLGVFGIGFQQLKKQFDVNHQYQAKLPFIATQWQNAKIDNLNAQFEHHKAIYNAHQSVLKHHYEANQQTKLLHFVQNQEHQLKQLQKQDDRLNQIVDPLTAQSYQLYEHAKAQIDTLTKAKVNIPTSAKHTAYYDRNEINHIIKQIEKD